MTFSAENVFFILFAGMALGGALSVILQRSPLYSALSLIVTFVATAALFVMLNAQFLAALQLIVYAGAIIVLFVFVIMLLNVRTEVGRLDAHRGLRWVGAPLAVLTCAIVAWAIYGATRPAGASDATIYKSPRSVVAGRVETVGHDLFTRYLLPFEATSVLIIMAIVGSIVLARRSMESDLALPVEFEGEPEPENVPSADVIEEAEV